MERKRLRGDCLIHGQSPLSRKISLFWDGNWWLNLNMAVCLAPIGNSGSFDIIVSENSPFTLKQLIISIFWWLWKENEILIVIFEKLFLKVTLCWNPHFHYHHPYIFPKNLGSYEEKSYLCRRKAALGKLKASFLCARLHFLCGKLEITLK